MPLPISRLVLVLALALSGCSLVGGDDAEIGFGVEIPTSLSTEVTLRGRSITLRDSQPTTGGVLRYTEPIKTSTGAATVACRVSSGTASATGTLELELEADWRYSVTCTTSATNPTDVCFGCRGSASVALDPALGQPADHRLWLVWAGDPKDSVVLY